MDNKFIEDANTLLEGFFDLSEDDKWRCPFPMGVFGTLRKNRGNDYLMGNKVGESVEKFESSFHRREGTRPQWSHWCKALMKNYYPYGLSLSHEPDATGPFEIWFYDEKNWKNMIPRVESLEGFHTRNDFHHGYHRTLAWLHVLPDDFKDETWESRTSYYARRDPSIKFSMKDLDGLAKVPAWIYSNCKANESSVKAGDEDLIWTGLGGDNDEFLEERTLKLLSANTEEPLFGGTK